VLLDQRSGNAAGVHFRRGANLLRQLARGHDIGNAEAAAWSQDA
jgi:hypothetical protein